MATEPTRLEHLVLACEPCVTGLMNSPNAGLLSFRQPHDHKLPTSFNPQGFCLRPSKKKLKVFLGGKFFEKKLDQKTLNKKSYQGTSKVFDQTFYEKFAGLVGTESLPLRSRIMSWVMVNVGGFTPNTPDKLF